MSVEDFVAARLDEAELEQSRIRKAPADNRDFRISFGHRPEVRTPAGIDHLGYVDYTWREMDVEEALEWWASCPSGADPKVLADIAAKRKLLVWDTPLDRRYRITTIAHDNLVRVLALAYADHPDYDPAWAPA